MQLPLQKLTPQQPTATPTPFQQHRTNPYLIGQHIIYRQMHMLIRHLLIKEPVIKSLNELIEGHVGELEAAQEVLALLDVG